MSQGTPEKAVLETAARQLFAPVDAASIVFFRVVFGLAMIWHLRYYLAYADAVRVYTGPSVLFKYHGFEWVQPAPEWALRLLFWVLAAAALCIALGLWYRLAAATFCLGYTYVFLLERAAFDNHKYLICLLALIFALIPGNRLGSLDAALSPRIRSPTVPAWALWLLRFQIGVPYFFGGLAKISSDWLLEAQPMTLWLSVGAAGAGLPEALKGPAAAYAFSWGGLVFDLGIVPLLLWRRTRPFAYAAAVVFNVSNSFIFEIGVFPWMMIAATTLFFDPDWPRRVGLAGARGAPAKAKKKAKKSEKRDRPAFGPRRRLTMALLAAFALVQVLVPLRHLVIPGRVDWTDEGFLFGWRMKMRDKYGSVRFAVVDRTTGKTTIFDDLDAVLTERQHLHLLHDPELIRQFAHHLARELRSRGQRDFEVRALTSIAFNGREPRPLVDPAVDLAAQRSTWRAASWILPAP